MLRDWVLKCDLKYSKRSLERRLILLLLCGVTLNTWQREVRLLDGNEVYFSKEDWPYYAHEVRF